MAVREAVNLFSQDIAGSIPVSGIEEDRLFSDMSLQSNRKRNYIYGE